MSNNKAKNKNRKSTAKTAKLGQAAFLASLVASSVIAPTSSAFAQQGDSTTPIDDNLNADTLQENIDLGDREAARETLKFDTAASLDNMFQSLTFAYIKPVVDDVADGLIAADPDITLAELESPLFRFSYQRLKDLAPADTGDGFIYTDRIFDFNEITVAVKARLLDELPINAQDLNPIVDSERTAIEAQGTFTVEEFLDLLYVGSHNRAVQWINDNGTGEYNPADPEDIDAADVIPDADIIEMVVTQIMKEYTDIRYTRHVRGHVQQEFAKYIAVHPAASTQSKLTNVTQMVRDRLGTERNVNTGIDAIDDAGLTGLLQPMVVRVSAELSPEFTDIGSQRVAQVVVEMTQSTLTTDYIARSDVDYAELEVKVTNRSRNHLLAIRQQENPNYEEPTTPDSPPLQGMPTQLGEQVDLENDWVVGENGPITINGVEVTVTVDEDGKVTEIKKVYSDRTVIIFNDEALGQVTATNITGTQNHTLEYLDANGNPVTEYYENDVLVRVDSVGETGLTDADGLETGPMPQFGDGELYPDVADSQWTGVDDDGNDVTLRFDSEGKIIRQVISYDDVDRIDYYNEDGLHVREVRDDGGLISRAIADPETGELDTPEYFRTETAVMEDGILTVTRADGSVHFSLPITHEYARGWMMANPQVEIVNIDSDAGEDVLQPITATDGTKYQWKFHNGMVTVTDESGNNVLQHAAPNDASLILFLNEAGIGIPADVVGNIPANANTNYTLVTAADGTEFHWKIDSENRVIILSSAGAVLISADADSAELAEFLNERDIELPGIGQPDDADDTNADDNAGDDDTTEAPTEGAAGEDVLKPVTAEDGTVYYWKLHDGKVTIAAVQNPDGSDILQYADPTDASLLQFLDERGIELPGIGQTDSGEETPEEEAPAEETPEEEAPVEEAPEEANSNQHPCQDEGVDNRVHWGWNEDAQQSCWVNGVVVVDDAHCDETADGVFTCVDNKQYDQNGNPIG